MKKYITWLIISIITCTIFVIWIIINNGTDDDLIFIADSVGISLSVNILASIIIIVFLESRDRRARFRRDRRATRKIASELRKFLASVPSGQDLITSNRIPEITSDQAKIWHKSLPDFYKRTEYLRDIFHDEISPELLHQLDTLLENDIKYITDPTTSQKLPTAEVKNIVTTIKKQYGTQMF